ncbi:diguanylate cyclase response regulator [Pokkaliibacter plantistimulans]|uniref:diguanylate cyclase n=1 Tax=Proteobacteria bacterium 228 TaxID=2083153 RepID=A0A2S5KTI3_9PROT|nr:diguanylate cyclase [Pokkaliibacter plantistimulans]PPC77839.1 diguanylate cyclase response regulator [Pokkaliibacter plantistimulans]
MRNILVVEDSPLVLKILNRQFKQEKNLTSVMCASAGEAQLMLETSSALFDAAIVDLNLPDAPNGEIVDLILSYKVPCIVLTSSYDEQRRDDLFMKGVVDYVIKESQYSYDYVFRLIHRLEQNRKIKIMIAEDSTSARHFIHRVLSSHQYQIVEARDGEESLKLLEQHADTDLLILDHGMPGIQGFELVKILRQKQKRQDLLILGVSADPKGSLSAMFIKHGADDFLRKPFCAEELTCRVMAMVERRDLTQALRQAALFDSLTGLYNRRAFYAEGGRVLKQAQELQYPISVAVIDLDHFKKINDTYGHSVGDNALKHFSRAFRKAFTDDVLVRLGGEEFGLVSYHSSEVVAQRLDKLRRDCQQIAYTEGDITPLSFSAGVYSGIADSVDILLHLADQLLYQVKHQGRGHTLTEQQG